MIEDLVLNPSYWIIVIATLLFCRAVVKFRILDFKFLVCLLLSQYVAHVGLIFGLSVYLVFCLLFIIAFVGGYHFYALLPNLTLDRSGDCLDVDKWVVRLSKIFLVSYSSWRLMNVPILSGPLDLALRLQLQHESRVAFFLSVVMLPPFVACMFYWLRERRFGWTDWVVLVLTVLGSLTSGSKVSILPLVLIYVGVRSYLGRYLKVNLWLMAGVVVAGSVFIVMLQSYFPMLTAGEIAGLLLYRIVANTDNLEYLYVTNLEPDQYPFSGPISLLPFVSKQLGVQIDYPYGVWLHGMRYGDWSGFGPNAGFLIEQFGNLNWAGVLVGAAHGALVRWTVRAQSVFRVMILSFCHVLLIESTTFFLNYFFCLLILLVAWVIARFNKGLKNAGISNDNERGVSESEFMESPGDTRAT
jgi:hypothetical protein